MPTSNAKTSSTYRARKRALRQLASWSLPLRTKAAEALRPTLTRQRAAKTGADRERHAGNAAVRKAGKRNPLEDYFRANDGRLIHKWIHYFDIYHRHFAKFRGKRITVVEFGVSQGGSLQMWKSYFGPRARIIGVDINPACADLAEEQIEIVIGDQDDREFLRSLAARVGKIDVLIEDGGHTATQQIATFEEMWPSIVDGGVFLMEDLHSAYWANYGGGFRREGTFIEYTKALIDQQNAWHSRDDQTFVVDDYTRTIGGLHSYDSIVVFDKATVRRPRAERTGTPSHGAAVQAQAEQLHKSTSG